MGDVADPSPNTDTRAEIDDAARVICGHMQYILERTDEPMTKVVAWALLGALAIGVPIHEEIRPEIITLLSVLADNEPCDCGKCGGEKIPPAAQVVLRHLAHVKLSDVL